MSHPISTYPRRILVTGATGKQGGAVLNALVRINAAAAPDVKYEILALTRGTGERLAKIPNVTVVRGDLDDVPAIFAQPAVANASLYGVYSVQIAFGRGSSAKKEIKQGMDLADAAAKAGVRHFVYSSVDRGVHSAPGVDLASPDAITGIDHWDTKIPIERHIQQLKLPYTIVRPPVFYEGWLDADINKIMGVLVKNAMKPDVKLQYIACDDIGGIIGVAFENPDRFIGQALNVAGDALTFAEIDAAFKEVVGTPAPSTYNLVSCAITSLVPIAKRTYKFFNEKGYRGDIAMTREIWPQTMTFRQWLEAQTKKTRE